MLLLDWAARGRIPARKVFLYVHWLRPTPRKLAFFRRMAKRQPELVVLGPTPSVVDVFAEAGFANRAVVPYPSAPLSPAPAPTEGKWMDVDLSMQTITAFEGTTPLKTVLVSTGLPNHPTPIGTFAVYLKVASQTMSGGVGAERYVLPGVPWIMYFVGGDAVHGTYWHKDFGRPKSHGCVNLPVDASKWLFDWAPIGTMVVTHK